MREIAEMPVLGHLFLFALMFILPVLLSFAVNAYIPGFGGDPGFTKAMLFLLPAWNLLLWITGTRLFCFYIPAWILFGIIALIKLIILITAE